MGGCGDAKGDGDGGGDANGDGDGGGDDVAHVAVDRKRQVCVRGVRHSPAEKANDKLSPKSFA